MGEAARFMISGGLLRAFGTCVDGEGSSVCMCVCYVEEISWELFG